MNWRSPARRSDTLLRREAQKGLSMVSPGRRSSALVLSYVTPSESQRTGGSGGKHLRQQFEAGIRVMFEHECQVDGVLDRHVLRLANEGIADVRVHIRAPDALLAMMYGVKSRRRVPISDTTRRSDGHSWRGNDMRIGGGCTRKVSAPPVATVTGASTITTNVGSTTRD